jgi:hypothetical protein
MGPVGTSYAYIQNKVFNMMTRRLSTSFVIAWPCLLVFTKQLERNCKNHSLQKLINISMHLFIPNPMRFATKANKNHHHSRHIE